MSNFSIAQEMVEELDNDELKEWWGRANGTSELRDQQRKVGRIALGREPTEEELTDHTRDMIAMLSDEMKRRNLFQ